MDRLTPSQTSNVENPINFNYAISMQSDLNYTTATSTIHNVGFVEIKPRRRWAALSAAGGLAIVFVVIFLLTGGHGSANAHSEDSHSPTQEDTDSLASASACAGQWSMCSAECTQTFSVIARASGGGEECEASQGQVRTCAPGEGQCPRSCTGITPPVHGQLGTCEDILQDGGRCSFECDAGYSRSGTQPVCRGGTLSHSVVCSVAAVQCEGQWSMCSAECTQTFSVIARASGGGEECEASQGQV
eukprot:SAG31_NODE_3233_length_4512_cov_72.476773_1_plen_244_part_10